MERKFHNEDFERLLRDNANQYRMYPSEKVWKGVYSALHTRTRWYRLSALLILLLTGSLVTISIIWKDNKTVATTSGKQPIISEPSSTTRQESRAAGIRDRDISSGSTSESTNIENLGTNNFPATEPVFNPDQPGLTESTANETGTENYLVRLDPFFPYSSSADAPGGYNLKASLNDRLFTAVLGINSTVEDISKNTDKNNIDQTLLALASREAPIELRPRPAKVTAQVYFTPTVSYRKLSENKSYTSNSSMNPVFNYIQLVDVNNVVNHKPAMGLELGIEGRYGITDRLFVKAGAQFNINRYDIRAYFHPTEFATIALNSDTGPDSLMALSNYRNFNGANVNWLENFYFTFSVPLGAEFIVFDNKKVQWGVSGSVQPSYVLGDRAYLISSDYKNYAKVPNLMRRINVSTDFETFISYSTGRLRWQVGPQVRYQHLSSFVNEYPVKENLFDIGLKIGAHLNKK